MLVIESIENKSISKGEVNQFIEQCHYISLLSSNNQYALGTREIIVVK